eukprot:TRINITY_DN3863_c0_g1_i1.p1 TRINITY_DN3863_c0_g1~~TRINITY_DN3863_c0_g1_i1.p1  ORF type:complete len:276 (+),score=79.04 TRINITY_DN3863_c0_g1_i1:78-830(+)
MARVLLAALGTLAFTAHGHGYTDEELAAACPDSPQCCKPSTCWSFPFVSSLHCAAWRGKCTCDGADVRSGWCRCQGRSICNEDGHCEDESGNVEAPDQEACDRHTGGSCLTAACDENRGAFCNAFKKCECPEGTCNIRGVCVPKNDEKKPSEGELQAEEHELEGELETIKKEEKKEADADKDKNGGTRLYEKATVSKVLAQPAYLGLGSFVIGGAVVAGVAAVVVRSRRSSAQGAMQLLADEETLEQAIE